MVTIKIKFDPEVDNFNHIIDIVNISFNSNKTEKSNNKNVCAECGKSVEQKVVNYCAIRYNGKTLCLDCQKKEGSGGP